jgi:hypothetical protein
MAGHPDPTPNTPKLIAVTADDDRFASSRQAAVNLAAREHAELILYDWEAPMLFGDPLPSVWSADGTDKAVPDRLDEKALEAAGRDAIARQVIEAKAAGVTATGWLPSERGADALVKYARDHHAIGIVVPRDIEESDDITAQAQRPPDGDDGEAPRSTSPIRVVVA